MLKDKETNIVSKIAIPSSLPQTKRQIGNHNDTGFVFYNAGENQYNESDEERMRERISKKQANPG